MISYRTLFAAFLLVASAGCSTPGLYATIPKQQLTAAKKLVVVPIVGDKIGYRRQGFVKNDINDLPIEEWNVNKTLGEQLQAALKNTYQLENVLYLSKPSDGLELLYNGNAAPGNTGLEFARIRPALRQIFESTGADTAVILFKGVTGIYGVGGRPYWVQGTVVSNGIGRCEIYPNMMLGIVDKKSLETVAANYVGPSDYQVAARAGLFMLPEEICESQLVGLSGSQTETIKKTFFRIFNERIFTEGISRLLAPAKN
jgi:hypothetical protein